MNFNKISSVEKIAFLIKPILYQLQKAGGQLSRTDIRERICNDDDNIATFEALIKTSKKTGVNYKPFNFTYNWAIRDLDFTKYIIYEKRNPIVSLTEKGMITDLDKLDPLTDVVIASGKFWEELSKGKKNNTPNDNEETLEPEKGTQENYDEEFKEKLLEAISKMSPKKFEMFSRLLLEKMGVSFTDKGTQISNDGGLDGFGYHKDIDDFRTSKVVIQCKRFNAGRVQSPDIDKFLGVVSKNQADYGIFITNSKFSKGARETALLGKPITLIDGNDLVELVKRYKLHIETITTYELLDFYYDEE